MNDYRIWNPIDPPTTTRYYNTESAARRAARALAVKAGWSIPIYRRELTVEGYSRWGHFATITEDRTASGNTKGDDR